MNVLLEQRNADPILTIGLTRLLYYRCPSKIVISHCLSLPAMMYAIVANYLYNFIEKLCLLFAVKNMVGGRTYYFRVLAHSNSTYERSAEYKYVVPARVKQKAVTAGVVGGILFFIVAIILSICAVKICNKRKRRKQEKG